MDTKCGALKEGYGSPPFVFTRLRAHPDLVRVIVGRSSVHVQPVAVVRQASRVTEHHSRHARFGMARWCVSILHHAPSNNWGSVQYRSINLRMGYRLMVSFMIIRCEDDWHSAFEISETLVDSC